MQTKNIFLLRFEHSFTKETMLFKFYFVKKLPVKIDIIKLCFILYIIKLSSRFCLKILNL